MPLFSPNFDPTPYTYKGENLREIAFPLGGIGTGCVSLDGRGGLRDWEIFNRPNKGSFLETTFPCLWFQVEGQQPRAMAVQGPRVKQWMGEGTGSGSYGHGSFFKQMDGLPCFDSVEFKGSFPLARVAFHKAGIPLKVELAAFNPFIPLDVRSSSFPAACLVYRLTNASNRRIDVTLCWTMLNPVGEPKRTDENDKALNELFDAGACRGILFSNDRYGVDDPAHGTAALTTNWPTITSLPCWKHGEWFDAVQAFWNEFRENGRFETGRPAEPGYRTPGSLGAAVSLESGQSAEIPFLISWVFPVAVKYWGQNDQPQAEPWKPHYATQWPTARDAATEFFTRYDELRDRTLSFEEALFSSTLPTEVIESISATASILHTPTVLRLEHGTFWAWEGCSPNDGCCSGTCSHVWNYSLAHAYLFPEMQWNMRRTEYKYNFNCGPTGREGALDFRVMLPLGSETKLWHAASDGQLGGVVQLYRDWRISGDEESLKELWPKAKKALEFAWVQWDRDRDGLVDGDMHNTYDINFQGPNPLTQFFYLAALRAGEEISRHLGDPQVADGYRKLFESGREKTNSLWNGEFFVQAMDCTGADAPKYQHGKGCLSDQVFGQLAASLAGLGDLADNALIKGALKAIFSNNFKDPLGDHENLQRVYAVSDEPGLILCSWPHGGRPRYPFVYSDEVWTGIEYQVASHMAFEGMVGEALAIVRGIRKRYDGVRRNPFNEFECGSHYARAMASFGLLLALSGFEYDAVSGVAKLSPRLQTKDFNCFFCTPKGWGIAIAQDGKTAFRAVEGIPP